MKISTVKLDVNAIEEGEWVEDIGGWPGVRIKTRGLNNSKADRMQVKAVSRVSFSARRNDEARAQLTQDLGKRTLYETCILDWDGFEDDDGNPIPYSLEQCKEWCTKPEFRAIRDLFTEAASMVGQAEADAREEATKN